MKMKFLMLLMVALCGKYAYGQLSEGGLPVAEDAKLKSTGEKIFSVDKPNIDSLLNQLTSTQQKRDIAAVAIDLDVDILTEGKSWEYQEGKVYELALQSRDATELIIHFSRFHLPEGARVYVYNDNAVLGAYTHKNNKSFGSLTLQELIGSDAKVQLYVPDGKEQDIKLKLGNVGYGFKKSLAEGDIDIYHDGFGRSLPCNHDINSKYGVFHQKEKRSVVAMTHLEHQFYIRYSAVLVNNYKEDGAPYFLTAKHCFEKVFTNREFHAEYAETAVAHFNYEATQSGENGDWTQTISGAEILCYDPSEEVGYYDLVLMRFEETPPEEYKPYYAAVKATEPEFDNKQSGDGRTQGNGSFAVIHHPGGDVKKITWYERVMNIGNDDIYKLTLEDHDGTIEGGSSGSPLFDKNHNVIGVLSSGSGPAYRSDCDMEYNDSYTLLDKNTSVIPVLDTFLFGKTGERKLEAYDPHEKEGQLMFYPSSLKIDHDEETLICKNTSTDNYSNFRWNFGMGAEPQSFTGKEPPAIRLLELGYHQVSLTAFNVETGQDETFVVDSLIQCRYGKAYPYFAISDKENGTTEKQGEEYLCELSDTLFLNNLSYGAADGYIYTIGKSNPIVIETTSREEVVKIPPFTQEFLDKHNYIQQAYYVPITLKQKHPEKDTTYKRTLKIYEPTIAAFDARRINHFGREMPDNYYMINEVELYLDNRSSGFDIRCKWYVNGVLKDEGRAGDFSFLASEPGIYNIKLITENNFSSDTATISVTYHLTVDVNNSKEPDLKVYPTVCQNSITMEIPVNEMELKLCDLNGKVILKEQLYRGTRSMDVSFLDKGIYLLSFESQTEQRTIKIIKQ